ncbi:ATP-binding cassette domain-containing protein [Zunongwangia sp. F363]|uniref:ATP-binding cassette domain-containing protein n=1 Tax=Autumnicola tepida TaxID=3075595 RepID=A0ABU3CBU0_9FLAO|nr:ATP-binding cassette domain-containing protein [Zunongwangia sp. F363]MDT0643799.1 ATP-binding cassette domain-containing protein [Zunongwangia sp. F363]
MKHIGIYVANYSIDGQWLQKNEEKIPGFESLQSGKGAVFSERVLKKFIEEDRRRDFSELIGAGKRSLRTFSSGEKRKALLDYLLKQNPDYIILDSLFDNLDAQSVENLKTRLQEISKEALIIQVFRRKEDLLPFIERVVFIENKEISKVCPVEEFTANPVSEEKPAGINNIPEAPGAFRNIPKILLKLENVCVNYDGRPILANINWEVKKGQFWKLTGPNGSGKTTILSMIYGDNPKAYGENVLLFGSKKGSGESVWEIKKKIGYFSPSLTELFSRRNTALEMLISGLVDSVGLYQKPTDKQLVLARSWLKTLNLEHREKQVFTKLPLLEQRLLLIARAMIKHPPLLILDEPTTALDDESALKIVRLTNLIAAESETAVIFVSHRKEKGLDPQFAYELCPAENGSKGRVL